jgi:hypothetical protein
MPRTKYVLFKCDWTDSTRDRGYKVDVYGLTLINFKNFVHRGDQITDELYVLTTYVEQVFYVEDDRNPDWACAVRTKPRNVYDVGQSQWPDDDKPNYYKSEPLLLECADHHCDPQDDLEYARTDLAPIEAYVISYKY